MVASISQVTADRAKAIEKLVLEDGTTSQWLHAATFETCFCIAVRSEHASWKIEGLLPDQQVVTLSHYRRTSSGSRVFKTGTPRYITKNVMCGLPIRFISSVPQPDPSIWVVFKS
ncbi:hypothetical protein TBK1r_44900 [Stieleria magnilauensis]|uniref:Uncharacterized protein n=1 Tax=Stieleria magnilauensis TaxID=2527963 RepID=A0ABX5XW03_9BACT|nr:hypothetical protein TBK1r_44900 [Planctomycetes bacterium TBK1r]